MEMVGWRGRALSAEVSIRNFIFPQDYPAVYLLWQNAGAGIHLRRSDTPEEIAKKLERDPDLFLVAEINEQIIGSVIGGFDGRRGFVYHLAVDAVHRGAGLGAALMAELEQRLKGKGCLKAYLFIAPENTAVTGFYQHIGWQPMDVIPFAKDLG
jgi:ribosomal protein S18 acetylase RimI-like enzyme